MTTAVALLSGRFVAVGVPIDAELRIITQMWMYINYNGGYPATFSIDDVGLSAQACRLLTQENKFAIDRVEISYLMPLPSRIKNGSVCD